MYKIKVVLAVAANRFLALTELKCLSNYKKDAKFYRVKGFQINDISLHVVYIYSPLFLQCCRNVS